MRKVTDSERNLILNKIAQKHSTIQIAKDLGLRIMQVRAIKAWHTMGKY